MTWVLGCGVPFGYGALISDTRVTFGDGSHRDVLQKIHAVAPGIMVGFAGSVSLGFRMVEDMQRNFALVPEGQYRDPRHVAFQWWRRGRRLFAAAKPSEQALRCALILVGATPRMNGPFYWSHCIRMQSPSFEPECERSARWLSIGSGSEHEVARGLAEDFMRKEFTYFGNLEVAMPQLGAANGAAMRVSFALQRKPVRGVSECLQLGIATPTETRIHNTTWETAQGRRIEPGNLATSWREFEAIASAENLSAMGAAA